MSLRRILRALVVAALMTPSFVAPGLAVQPNEVLADPTLESRAREISQGLRCLVCRNENIDDSNADLARDLRLLVRERLTAGDSDAEVLDFVTDRYGEYVLLQPRVTGANWLLWGAGPAMLLLGLIGALVFVRRRGRAADVPDRLSETEAARLREILKE
ncbi:cytochrome c-type biogenesis protein [Pseudooceanicola algae]|uniref:Cytochrome c-type biogenesis protein n=1 Tax=Pseudooceanicola algae TaxID=1537215 RepID=A0A418SFH3_9RHOB|nr:cytochrome c-type biogenesis protein [Pseudooceanicola algae]QPM89851.1 Cytochrome c-type biogenesis protein CcmH [Pseudooceanicola algae]